MALGIGFWHLFLNRKVWPARLNEAVSLAQASTHSAVVKHYRDCVSPILPAVTGQLQEVSSQVEAGVMDLMARLEHLMDQAWRQAKETSDQFTGSVRAATMQEGKVVTLEDCKDMLTIFV